MPRLLDLRKYLRKENLSVNDKRKLRQLYKYFDKEIDKMKHLQSRINIRLDR